MDSLEDLIRQKRIEFSSFGRDIPITMDDFGEYNRDLIKHIAEKAGKFITISGPGLEEYLKEPANLYRMADFTNFIWYHATTGSYQEGASVHIDVDIDKFADTYVPPKDQTMVNGLGQKVCDTASWVPEMPFFEKVWNFALCQAVGGMVGYPGYEHPTTDEGFRIEAANHARNYMIGTKEQLKRYKKYAYESLDWLFKRTDELREDPDKMFEDPYILYGIANLAKDAREIAENVSHFTIDFKRG